MASALEGWSRKEKLYILQGLNNLDFDKMETKIPTRTRQEIKNAVLCVVNGLGDQPRMKRVSMSTLQRLVSITARDPQQHRLKIQIVRMLPNFNYVPPTGRILNIDIIELFKQIANAIEGRPVVADAATMDILDLIVEELSELCEGYMSPELKAFIARINSSAIPMPPSAARKKQLLSFPGGMHAPAQTNILPIYPPANTDIPSMYSPPLANIPPRYPPANNIPPKYPPANTDILPMYPPANTDMPPMFPPANTDIPPRYPSANTDMPPIYPPANTDIPPMYPPANTDIPLRYPPVNTDIPPMYPPANTDNPPMYPPANTNIPPRYPLVNTDIPAMYSPAKINIPAMYSPANTIIPAIYSPAKPNNSEIYEPVNTNIPAMYARNSQPAKCEFEPINAPATCQYGPVIAPVTYQYEPVLAATNYTYDPTHAPPKMIYNPTAYPAAIGNYNQLYAAPLYNIICTPGKANCGLPPCNIYDTISAATVPAHPPRLEFRSSTAGNGAYHGRSNGRYGHGKNRQK